MSQHEAYFGKPKAGYLTDEPFTASMKMAEITQLLCGPLPSSIKWE